VICNGNAALTRHFITHVPLLDGQQFCVTSTQSAALDRKMKSENQDCMYEGFTALQHAATERQLVREGLTLDSVTKPIYGSDKLNSSA